MIDVARQVALHEARQVLEPDDLILRIMESTFAYVDVPRMQNLRERCLDAVPGAFVECGVAQGASLTLMTSLAQGRQVWGFDSFEGLPPLTEGDEGDGEWIVGFACSGERGLEAVTGTFATLGVPMDDVHLVKGWFEDTIPGARREVGDIAVLRLDSDFHDSTLYTLEQLYPQVAEGGAVIIDDYYSFTGCRRAVDSYRAEHGIEDPLIVTHPKSEVWWRKTTPAHVVG